MKPNRRPLEAFCDGYDIATFKIIPLFVGHAKVNLPIIA